MATEPIRQTAAGRLFYKVAFDVREDQEDEYGNMVAAWVEQFQRRAEFRNLPGSETVMQSRLAGNQPMQVNIRLDSQVARIGNDWQMRNVRNGLAYNIRDIRIDNNRAVMTFMVETGVATG